MSKVTIVGWIARDSGGPLYMYANKPEKDVSIGCWFAEGGMLALSDRFLPNLTWDTEPKPCKITIEI